jgi:hypothetical protein
MHGNVKKEINRSKDGMNIEWFDLWLDFKKVCVVVFLGRKCVENGG